MAEWLRRLTLKQLRSSRVGSSAIFVVYLIVFYGVIDSNLLFDFSYPSSNLGKNWYLENLSHHLLLLFRKKITEKEFSAQRCFGRLVTLLHISSKSADDIVENNDQVILQGLEEGSFSVIGTHNNDYNKKS